MARVLRGFGHNPDIDRFFKEREEMVSYVNTRKPHRLLPQRLRGNYNLAAGELEFKQGDSMFDKDKLKIIQLLRSVGLSPSSDIEDLEVWTQRELNSLQPFVRKAGYKSTLHDWSGLTENEREYAIIAREAAIKRSMRDDTEYRSNNLRIMDEEQRQEGIKRAAIGKLKQKIITNVEPQQ